MEQVQPLQGTLVVDLTHLLAGPFCTMLMADAGATVLKIEPPTGDISRQRLPRYTATDGTEISAYFGAVNRGKSSVVLDLKSGLGMKALDQLLARADVIVMNYRERAIQRLRIDPDRLRGIYPRAVIASITAFGRKPGATEAERPGLAIVAEAVSGITSLTRGDDGSPRWVGFALGDFVAGQTAFGAISASLVRAAKTGEGCYLDMSMTDSLLAFNGVELIRAQALAAGPSRAGDGPNQDQAKPVPYGVYPTADGHVVIGCNTDEFWKRLCDAMGPDLDQDMHRFDVESERFRHRDVVSRLVSAWTRSGTRQEILARMIDAGVPCGPVSTAADVLADGHLRARGALGDVRLGDGTVTVPQGSLGMVSGGDGVLPRLPALGEDTATVLTSYTDLTRAEINEILAQQR